MESMFKGLLECQNIQEAYLVLHYMFKTKKHMHLKHIMIQCSSQYAPLWLSEIISVSPIGCNCLGILQTQILAKKGHCTYLYRED